VDLVEAVGKSLDLYMTREQRDHAWTEVLQLKDKLHKAVNARDEVRDALRDKVAELQAANQALQAEVDRLQVQVEAQELTDPAIRAQGLEMDRQELLGQVKALQAEVDLLRALQAERDEAVSRVALWDTALQERNEAQERLAHWKTTLHAVERDCRALQADNQALQEQIAQIRKERDEALANVADLQTTIKQVVQERDDYKDRNWKASQERNRFQDLLDEAQNTIMERDAQIAEAKAVLEQVEAQRDQARKNATDHLQMLDAEQRKHEAQVQDLRNKLKQSAGL
jgi:chromosome segregation ATPase